MKRYQLTIYGYKRNGEKCPIGYELFDNRSKAAFQGEAVCDFLSSLTGIYACYGYDVDELDLDMRPKEV